MNESTLRLAETMVRHHKGIATALEDWIEKQPSSPSLDELCRVVRMQRQVLTAYEARLAMVKTSPV